MTCDDITVTRVLPTQKRTFISVDGTHLINFTQHYLGLTTTFVSQRHQISLILQSVTGSVWFKDAPIWNKLLFQYWPINHSIYSTLMKHIIHYRMTFIFSPQMFCCLNWAWVCFPERGCKQRKHTFKKMSYTYFTGIDAVVSFIRYVASKIHNLNCCVYIQCIWSNIVLVPPSFSDLLRIYVF